MPFWGHKYCQNWTTGPNLQYPEKSNNKFKKERAIFFFFFFFNPGSAPWPASTPRKSCLSLFCHIWFLNFTIPATCGPCLTWTLPSLFPHLAYLFPLSSSLLSLYGYMAFSLLWILQVLSIPCNFSLRPFHVNLAPLPLSYDKQSSVVVVLESFWLSLNLGFTLLVSCLTLGEPLMVSEFLHPQL